MKKVYQRLLTNTSATPFVDGYTFDGHLIIHRDLCDKSYWSISHFSGFLVSHGFSSLREAKKSLQAIQPLANWCECDMRYYHSLPRSVQRAIAFA